MLELQTPRVERGLTAIPTRAPDRRTVPPDDRSFRIGSVFDGPLDRPHPTHPLAQFLLRVPIGLSNRPAGFSQIMKRAELMRDPRQDLGHRLADGLLTIAEYAHHRHVL